MKDKRLLFQRPKKEETLVIKQEEKIRKHNHLQVQAQLSRVSSASWVKIAEIFAVIFLFLANFYFLLPFFGKEDRNNVFSAPLILILTHLTSKFLPILYGVRFWILVFMLFFPVSFYLLVKEITKRKLTSFLSTAITILPLSYFLLSRVNLGILGQDGAHIASLTITPFACLLLLKFLRFGNFLSGVLTAILFTLIALTSAIGLMILIIFASFITFSEMLLGQGRLKALRFLTVLVFAAGFSAFWYNPQFVLYLIFKTPQGELLQKTAFNLFPLSFFLVPILTAFGFLIFENRPDLQPLFLAVFLTIAFFLLSLGSGFSQVSPVRFFPSLGISLSSLLGILIVKTFDVLRFSPRLDRFKIKDSVRQIIAFLFLGLVFGFLIFSFFYFQKNLYEKELVLGASFPDKIVGIWEIRETITKVENLFGYLLTGLTIFLTGTLGLKFQKRK